MGVVIPFIPKGAKCERCGVNADSAVYAKGELVAITCKACKPDLEDVINLVDSAVTLFGAKHCPDPNCKVCGRGAG